MPKRRPDAGVRLLQSRRGSYNLGDRVPAARLPRAGPVRGLYRPAPVFRTRPGGIQNIDAVKLRDSGADVPWG